MAEMHPADEILPPRMLLTVVDNAQARLKAAEEHDFGSEAYTAEIEKALPMLEKAQRLIDDRTAPELVTAIERSLHDVENYLERDWTLLQEETDIGGNDDDSLLASVRRLRRTIEMSDTLQSRRTS